MEVDVNMQIWIDRASVCMGDDVENHRINIDVDENLNFEELFRYIVNLKYLPNISGNDVVWSMIYGEDAEIAAYQTINNKIYTTFINEIPLVKKCLSYSDKGVYFKYYSTREMRAKYIFCKFGGHAYHIWHEGFSDEYKSYSITTEMENNWRRALD